MTSQKDKWPNSWDYHISQYCNFYFCDKDIKYMDRNFWTEAKTDREGLKITTMDLRFQIGEHQYMVGLHRGEGTHFSCSIFYKKSIETLVEDYTDIFEATTAGDMAILDSVAGIGGYDMTVSEIMEFAEQMMWEDYRKRNEDDWDNDNGENNTIEPLSPTEIVEPELTLV